MIPRDVDRNGSPRQLLPCRAVHFPQQDGVLTGLDPNEVAAYRIKSHRRSCGPEQDSRSASLPDPVEVHGHRGGEVVRQHPVEKDFFPSSELIHWVLRRRAEGQGLSLGAVKLWMPKEGVVGGEIRGVGELEQEVLLSCGAGKGEGRRHGPTKKGPPITRPFERLCENGSSPAGRAVPLGVKDLPPFGAIRRLDEAGVTNAKGF